jgi:hypothetical protein
MGRTKDIDKQLGNYGFVTLIMKYDSDFDEIN